MAPPLPPLAEADTRDHKGEPKQCLQGPTPVGKRAVPVRRTRGPASELGTTNRKTHGRDQTAATRAHFCKQLRPTLSDTAQSMPFPLKSFDAEALLTLITASREHIGSVTANSDEAINTFSKGGLDYLGAEMYGLGLPRSITSQWEAQGWALNPESNSQVRPARIPAKDQVLAYAAQINASFEQRFKLYLRECIGDNASAALNRSARAAILVWKAYAFLAPGGSPFKTNVTVSAQLGQRFGIRTCLQYLKSKNPDLTLEAVVTDPALNGCEWIRIAKVRTAESLFLERVLATTRDLLSPVF